MLQCVMRKCSAIETQSDMSHLSKSRMRPIGRRTPIKNRDTTSTAAGVANSILHLAPEGRHVYSTRHTPNNQSPRGATCGYNA